MVLFSALDYYENIEYDDGRLIKNILSLKKEQIRTVGDIDAIIIKQSKLAAASSLEARKETITDILTKLANELWWEKKKDPRFI